MVIVIAVAIIVIMVMEDHDLVVMIIVAITMMKHHNLVVLIVTIMMNLDNFAMMVPIPVLVLVADADGHPAFLGDHYWLVDCRRPGQRRSAQDCKRARDKSKFVHVIFLHRCDECSLRRLQTGFPPGRAYATRKARTAVVGSSALEKYAYRSKGQL